MRIWLVQIGEPLPIDPGHPRLFRTGLLAELLAARGHKVVWWAAAFNHSTQSFRAESLESREVKKNLSLFLLRSAGYKKPMSLARIRSHRELARDFRMRSQSVPTPDLIVASYPLVELCEAATEIGQQLRVPVVLDVRDLWPEIFVRAVPRGLRWAASVALIPARRQARRALRVATAVMGITEGILDWALNYAGRVRTNFDRAFPHGYRLPSLSAEEHAKSIAFWRALGVSHQSDEFVVCYFGALGNIVEFDTVQAAAKLLLAGNRRVRFVFCGSGGRESQFRKQAANLPNVTFAGWVGAPEIAVLMEIAQVGIVCYHSTFDYEASIPNKPIEYLAAGLPVLCSLRRGILRELLEREDCGAPYTNGDPQSLVTLLERLHDHPDLVNTMSLAASRTFQKYFDATTVYTEMAEHLETIAARSGAPHPA